MKKDQSVETLRGAAIILVVIGHVIGTDSLGGMKVADDSIWRHIYFSFEFIRMPLFTMISGWVYSLRPPQLHILKDFTIKKIRRILLPMAVAGTLYFLLQLITPGTNSTGKIEEIWKIYIFPYTQFWYLPALFLIFLLVSILDSFRFIDKFLYWGIFTIATLLIMIFFKSYVPDSVPNIFAFKNAIYLLPFFLIGIGINRFKMIFSNKYLIYSLTVILVCLLVMQQLYWYNIIELQLSKRSGIGLYIGIIGSIILLNLKWKVNWLIWIGNYAYTIFLYHAFGTAAGRILIKKIGVDNSLIIFTTSLLIGIIFPILIEYIFNKNSYSRVILLGKSFNMKSKE